MHADEDRDPATGERTLCSSDLPDDLAPVSYQVVPKPAGPALAVEWSDARTTMHDLRWLQEHAYAAAGDAPVTAALPLTVVELWQRGRDEGDVAREALQLVEAHGVAIVRATVESTNAARWVEAFARAGLAATHLNHIEDRSGPRAQRDPRTRLHTEQAFLEDPPRYQLLQSLAEGGEHLFVDGRAASEYFASVAAHDHALLTTLPVRFSRRRAHEAPREVVAPIIRPATAATPFRIRYSYSSLAPVSVPFALTPAFYRAHDAFARLLRDPTRVLRVALASGDLALYDNHRMLHARASADDGVRGIYFDQGDGI